MVVTSFPMGEMMLGIVAMNVHNFRHLLRILYTPGLFVIFYFWIVPESPRWLLISGRVDRAIKVLKRIAWCNGKNLSEKSIDMLRTQYSPDEQINMDGSKDEPLSILQQMRLIIQSRKLGLRLLNCCYQWVSEVYFVEFSRKRQQQQRIFFYFQGDVLFLLLRLEYDINTHSGKSIH